MDDLSVWPSQVWAHLCVFTEYSPAEGALYYDSFMCKTKRALISPHQRRCRKCHDAFTCLSQTEPMFLFCKGGRNVALWHCKESFLYIAPRVIWRSQAHSLSRAFKEGPMAPWVYSVHYKYFNLAHLVPWRPVAWRPLGQPWTWALTRGSRISKSSKACTPFLSWDEAIKILRLLLTCPHLQLQAHALTPSTFQTICHSSAERDKCHINTDAGPVAVR